MIDRRAAVGCVMGLCGASLLAGCSSRPAPDRGGSGDVPASWCKVRVGVPAAIDPALVHDRAGLDVLRYLFTPLLAIQDGAPVPAAARAYDMSEDARTFTFSLREGATFHHGETVTASSFKRAWERLVAGPGGDSATDRETSSPWAPLLSAVEGYDALLEGRASEMVGLRCPDDLTLEVGLSEPFAGFVDLTAHPALGPVPSTAEIDPDGYAAQPWGNGPYKLDAAWNGKDNLRLSAFDAGCVAAQSEGVLLTPIDDTSAAFNQFLAGALDICDVPVGDLDDALDTAGESDAPGVIMPGARCTAPQPSRITYLMCNTAEGALSHPELRRAASYAIDRDTLARKVLGGCGQAASSLVGAAVAEVDGWQVCQYDEEAAQRLVSDLVAAVEDERRAWAQRGSAGEEEAGEEPEPLDISVRLLHRKGGVNAKVAARVADDLKAAGFEVKVESLSEDDLRARIDEGSFECVLASFEPPVATLEASLAPLMGEGPSYGAVGAMQVPQDVAAPLSSVRANGNQQLRHEQLREALTHASERLCLVPIAFTATHVVASNRVEAASLDALGCLDPASIVMV